MKEMEYKYMPENPRWHEVLADEQYRGYRFVIMNYGTHPCAYIVIPIGHPLWGKQYCESQILKNIDVHGGFTFTDKHPWIDDQWCIGWDYAHCDDYAAYYELFTSPLGRTTKKWTTAEILEEVKQVIDQLIDKFKVRI